MTATEAEPTVTVAITCHNQEAYIAEAIASALNQRPRPAVVVVDDGSTDASRARIKDFEAQVRLVATPNRGVAASRNEGLEAVKTEYVVLLDGDDRLPDGFIATCMEALEAHPEAGYAYPNLQMFGAKPGFDACPSGISENSGTGTS